MSRRGIPNFEATAKERELVEMVSGIGVPHELIVYLIEREDADGNMRPISVDTLTRHFSEELKTGKVKTIAKVAGKLVATALGQPGPQATTSQIFFLKTVAGWKETAGLELTTPESEEADETAIAAKVAGLIQRGLQRSRGEGGEETPTVQ